MKKLIVWVSMLVLVFTSAPSFAQFRRGAGRAAGEAARGASRAAGEAARGASRAAGEAARGAERAGRNAGHSGGRAAEGAGRSATHGNSNAGRSGSATHGNSGAGRSGEATHGNGGAGRGGSRATEGSGRAGGEATHGNSGAGRNANHGNSSAGRGGSATHGNSSAEHSANQGRGSTARNATRPNGNRAGNNSAYKPSSNAKDLAAQDRANRAPNHTATPNASSLSQPVSTAQQRLVASGAINADLFAGQEALAESADRASQAVHAIPNIGFEKYPDATVVPSFSLSVIQKEGEIYGLIPTHSLPKNIAEAQFQIGVTKDFEFPVTLADGSTVSVRGEVVQISPESMLDISLVKFDPRYEKLLKPVEYVSEEPPIGEELFSFGNANGIPAFSRRTVKGNSQLSIRTNLIEVGEETIGYCGGLIFNKEGRGVGIHTGSVNETSYATHAHFINNLIEAYHNGGKSEYNLMFDDRVLTTLNIDEYIFATSLTDEFFNVIYQERGTTSVFGVTKKFSENHLHELIAEHPGAKFVVLQSRKLVWQKGENGEFALLEDHGKKSAVKGHAREHIFNLETKELFTTVDRPEMFITEVTEQPKIELVNDISDMPDLQDLPELPELSDLPDNLLFDALQNIDEADFQNIIHKKHPKK